MLELSLKACLVINNIRFADQIIWFAKSNNQLLSLDEETVWHIVKQTQPGWPLSGNFNIMRMVIFHELSFKVKMTE